MLNCIIGKREKNISQNVHSSYNHKILVDVGKGDGSAEQFLVLPEWEQQP